MGRTTRKPTTFLNVIIALLIVAVLAGSLFFVFAKCAASFPPADEPEIQRQQAQAAILAHLKQKYGDIKYDTINTVPIDGEDNFKLVSSLPGGSDYYDSFDATRFDNNGTYTYQDNYYGLLIRTEYEAMIKKVADKYFKDCIVYTTYEDFPDNVNASTTLRQTLDNGWMAHSSIYVYINARYYKASSYLDKQKFSVDFQSFTKAWKQITDRSSVDAQLVPDATYAKLKNRDYQDKLKDEDDLADQSVIYTDWNTDRVPGVDE
jgi:hypothetical protein